MLEFETVIPARVTTDGVFTEYFDPDVFVSRERITGDGIDPDTPLELRVEFTKTGRDGTLVRIVQGPYEPDVAGYHSRGWERRAEPARGPPGRPAGGGDAAMSSVTRATTPATIVRQRPLAQAHATIVRQKPLMNMRQVLLMNLGFFESSTASACSRPP